MIYLYKFFNKDGYNITPYLENGVYNIDIQLNDVSIGLYETEQLHIFEQVYCSDKVHDDIVIPSGFLGTILNRINAYNSENKLCLYSDLIDLFETEYSFKDVVYEYCNSNSEYIDCIYDDYKKQYNYRLSDLGLQLDLFNDYKIEETILKNQGYEKKLTRPRLKKLNEDDLNCLHFKWDDTTNDNISLFTISDEVVNITNRNDINKTNEIVPCVQNITNSYLNSDEWKTFSKELYEFDNSISDYYIDDDVLPGRKIINSKNINNSPFTINFMINSELEGKFNKTLTIYIYEKQKYFDDGVEKYKSNYYSFININISGNVIGEDERLKLLLQNFGRDIDTSDFYVIRDFDLDDDRLDYIAINEKRKELLIEGENIFPYLGSYKALYNGLKWLGFQDIVIKEYFYNIKLSSPKDKKIVYNEIIVPLESDSKYDKSKNYILDKYSNMVTSQDWRKTTRLGLMYSFNQFQGDYDSSGLPIMINKNDFNSEELLIKLYGLKKFLYKYLLPHNARIINISLEGLYFTKVHLSNWNNVLPIVNLIKKPDFKITVNNNKQQLSDLIELIELYCKYKHERSYLDQFYKLKDFISAYNHNLYNDLKISEFSKYKLGTFNKIKSDISDNKLFNDIVDLLDSKFPTCADFRMWVETFINDKENNCTKCNTTNIISDRLEAGIFRLKAVENKITLKDIADIPIGFFSTSVLNCYPKSNKLNELDKIYNDVGMCWCGSDDKNNPRTWDSYPTIKWNYEFFNIHNNSNVEWFINHSDLDYCKRISGTYKNNGDILFLAPFVGDYDALCSITDDFNFPKIVRKEKLFSIIEPEFDIVSFGKQAEVLNTFNSTKLSDISGNYRNFYANKIKYDFEEMVLSYNDFTYSNYLIQDYYIEFCKFSDITNIDIFNSTFDIVDVDSFNTDFDKYENNWDNLYIVKNDRNNLLTNIPVKKITQNKIVLYGDYSDILKQREVLVSYNILESVNFTINDNVIKILIPEDIKLEWFSTDLLFTLSEDEFDNETNTKKQKEYKSSEVIYDYDNHNLIISVLDINKDLNFKPSINDEQNLEYNYSNWSLISIKYNISRNRVSVATFDDINNETIIKLSKNNILNENQFFIDVGLIDQDFRVINKDNIRKIDNKISIYSEDICVLTPGYKLVWAPFDILRARNNTKMDNMTFEIMKNTRYCDLLNQTYDSLTFKTPDILGFDIKNVENIIIPYSDIEGNIIYDNIPTITFNNKIYELKISPFVNPFPYDNHNNDINDIIKRYIYDELVLLLNNITTEYISDFIYVNMNYEYIKAISKFNNSQIYSISSNVISTSKNNTISTDVWPYRQFCEFENIENFQNNISFRNYNENINIVNNITDVNYLNTSLISGMFDFGMTFVKTKQYEFSGNIPIFFTISNKEYYDNDKWNFNWDLFLEDILICQSSMNYINWFVDKIGSYTIKLKLTNKKDGHVIYKEKISFFKKIK